MYFSVIEPTEGLEREAAFSRLEGPYAEHQWLWRFFPAPEGTKRDFLFRRMDIATGTRFYVVSARQPIQLSPSWSVQSRAYSPKIFKGQHLLFDLRVNPVVITTRDGKKCRDDVVIKCKKSLLAKQGLVKWSDWNPQDRPAEYDVVTGAGKEWLCRALDDQLSRAERAGFTVLDDSIRVDAYQQHRTEKKGVRFSTIDLTGELEVSDPALFLATLQNGIGHGKAFGCGLLLVRKA